MLLNDGLNTCRKVKLIGTENELCADKDAE